MLQSFDLKIDCSLFFEKKKLWCFQTLNFACIESKWKGTNPITMQLFSCYPIYKPQCLNITKLRFFVYTFRGKTHAKAVKNLTWRKVSMSFWCEVMEKKFAIQPLLHCNAHTKNMYKNFLAPRSYFDIFHRL